MYFLSFAANSFTAGTQTAVATVKFNARRILRMQNSRARDECLGAMKTDVTHIFHPIVAGSVRLCVSAKINIHLSI